MRPKTERQEAAVESQKFKEKIIQNQTEANIESELVDRRNR